MRLVAGLLLAGSLLLAGCGGGPAALAWGQVSRADWTACGVAYGHFLLPKDDPVGALGDGLAHQLATNENNPAVRALYADLARAGRLEQLQDRAALNRAWTAAARQCRVAAKAVS